MTIAPKFDVGDVYDVYQNGFRLKLCEYSNYISNLYGKICSCCPRSTCNFLYIVKITVDLGVIEGSSGTAHVVQ